MESGLGAGSVPSNPAAVRICSPVKHEPEPGGESSLMLLKADRRIRAFSFPNARMW
jgi:hypothetical protein